MVVIVTPCTMSLVCEILLQTLIVSVPYCTMKWHYLKKKQFYVIFSYFVNNFLFPVSFFFSKDFHP